MMFKFPSWSSLPKQVKYGIYAISAIALLMVASQIYSCVAS